MSSSQEACKPCMGTNVRFSCRSNKESYCSNNEPFAIYVAEPGPEKVVVFAPIDPDSDTWSGSVAPLTNVKGATYAMVLIQESLVERKIDDINKGFVFEDPSNPTGSRLIPLIQYFDQVGGLKTDLLPVKTKHRDMELSGTAAYFLSRIPRSTQDPDRYINVKKCNLVVHSSEPSDACCTKDKPILGLRAGNSDLVITPMSVKCYGMTVPVVGFAHESMFAEIKKLCPDACCKSCEIGNKRLCVSKSIQPCMDKCVDEKGESECGLGGDEENEDEKSKEENPNYTKCKDAAIGECGLEEYVKCEKGKFECIEDGDGQEECEDEYGDCSLKAIPGLCGVKSTGTIFSDETEATDCKEYCDELCKKLGEPLKIKIKSLGSKLNDMGPLKAERNNLFWAGLPIPLDTSQGNQRLPSKFQVANKCVPLFNGKNMTPYLIAYSNRSTPSLNYNFGPIKLDQAMGWRNMFAVLKQFRDMVEDNRKRKVGGLWYTRLSQFDKHKQVFNKFYYSLVGNSEELWVLGYLAGSSSVQGGGSLGSTTMRSIDIVDHNIPKILNREEQLTLLYDESVSSQSDSCWLPVYHDCRVSASATLNKLPSDVCSGRASKSNENRCEFAFSRMSNVQKTNLIDRYCQSNPWSFDCQCYNRLDDPTFSYISEQFKDKIQIRDSCWWKPCLSRDNTMFVLPQDEVNCGKACFDLLYIGGSSNIDISGLTQISTCGALDLEDEDGIGNGKEAEKPKTYTELAQENLVLVFVFLTLFIMTVVVLIGRKQLLKNNESGSQSKIKNSLF